MFLWLEWDLIHEFFTHEIGTHLSIYTYMVHYHVDLVVVLQDADAEEEGKEKLVRLKERAADIAVQAEGEVLIDVIYPLLKDICREISSV